MYRARSSDNGPRDPRVGRLGVEGVFLNEVSTPRLPGGTAAWAGTTWWTADSDGKWIGLLARQTPVGEPANETKKLVLQIYEAENFSFVDQVELASAANDLDVIPVDVSIFEDTKGNAQVLSVFLLSHPGGTKPIFSTYYSVATRPPTGGFSQKTKVLVDKQVKASEAAAVRIPCREEWLLGYAVVVDAVGYRDLRRVGVDAEFVGPAVDEIADNALLPGMSAGEARCDSTDPQILAVLSTGANAGRARVWSIDRGTGGFSRVGSDVDLGLLNVSAVQRRGRWFIAGVAGDSPYPASAREIDTTAVVAAERVKVISLFQSGVGAEPGILSAGYGVGFASPGRAGIVDLGSILVLAFPDGFVNSNSNLDSLRSPALPNSTAPAVAVTYRVGCL